jgi:hypothetical protein
MKSMISGKILCSEFKTSKTFKFQVITPSVIVQCYIDHFRVEGGSDKLFVNTRGDGLKQGMINKGKCCCNDLY